MIKQIQDDNDTRKNLFLDKEGKIFLKLYIFTKKEFLML